MMMDLRNRIKNNRKQVEKNEFAEPNQKIADYMMAEYPAPDALKEQILKAMTEQRAREEQAEEKYSNIHRKAFKHVAAAAALLAFFMGFTPIRGMVVSAAEEFRYLTSWTDDVFEIGIKKTKHHCTMELIEASVANDFLYLTMNNSYRNEGLEGSGISVKYSGYIYDSIFHKLAFSMDNIYNSNVYYNASRPITVFSQDDYYDYDYDDFAKIYIPEMKNFITDTDKPYKCKLTADFVDKNGRSIAKIKFKFQIGTTDGVTTSKEIPLSYTTTVDDLRFDFEKAVVSKNGSAELFVQLIPQNGYKINKNLEIWMQVALGHDDQIIDWRGYFLDFAHGCPPIYRVDSRYYAVLSLNGYDAYEGPSDFDFNEEDFHLYLISLGYYDCDSDVRIWDKDSNPVWHEASGYDIDDSEDYTLPQLNVNYHKINVSVNHIGPQYAGKITDKNKLTIDDREFTFESLVLHNDEGSLYMEGDLYMTIGYLSDETSGASYWDVCVTHTELAAVKDGKVLYTVAIKGSSSLSVYNPINSIGGTVQFYDKDGNVTTYKAIKELEYDDIVVTRFQFYTYDNNGNTDGYHCCYHPKYCSKAQCEEDVAAKIEAVQSRVIR